MDLGAWNFLDRNMQASIASGRKRATDVITLRKKAQAEHRRIFKAIRRQGAGAAE